MLRLTTLVVVAVALAACSKKSNKKEPSPVAAGSSAATNAGSGGGSSAGSNVGSDVSASAGSNAGSGAAAPARSLTGDLQLSGSLTGTFHWNKKGELSCGAGGVHIDFTDGKDHDTGGSLMAGLDGTDDSDNDDADTRHDLILEVDSMAPARLALISAHLPAPMKTSKGFKMTVGEDRHIQVTVDTTLTDIIVDPDAPKERKSKKKAKKPAGPKVTIKGTLEIECPPLPK